MLPFVIAAAASILANQQKQRREREQLYLDQLERNASRFGGNTDMAQVLERGRSINDEGANYGGALGLVGQLSSSGGGDSTSGIGGVDILPKGGSAMGDVDDLLKGWKTDDPENDDDFALLGVRRR